MGFYDLRCLISGLSLKPAKADVILLRHQKDGSWRPVSYAIRGAYNRLGAVDIPDSAHVWYDIIDGGTRRGWLDPIACGGVEYEGARLGLALVHAKIADAVIKQVKALDDPDLEDTSQPLARRRRGLTLLRGHKRGQFLADRLWGDDVLGRQYQPFPDCRKAGRLWVLTRWMQHHHGGWVPNPDPHQHYEEEIARYAEEARLRLKDYPLLLETVNVLYPPESESEAVPLAVSAESANETRLEFVGGSSAKFWVVATAGCDLVTRWGRLGSDGQTKRKTFGTPEKAEAERTKQIQMKTKKGYQEV